MMQEQNKFFRFVWRLDAILLALVGILAIGLIGTVFIEYWTFNGYRPVPEGHFAPVPKSAELNNTYRLEVLPDVASLQNEQFYSLQRWNEPPRDYGLAMVSAARSESFYHYANAVNVLAVDTGTVKSHWLFNGYHRAVVDQQGIYKGGPITNSGPVPFGQRQVEDPIALVIRTVDKDSNNDGELNSKDRQSLYYYRPADNQAVKFFDADYIISMQEVDGGNFFVVYEKGQSAFAATFGVPNFKLLSEHSLPDVPQ
jgi:hypothetical protein